MKCYTSETTVGSASFETLGAGGDDGGALRLNERGCATCLIEVECTSGALADFRVQVQPHPSAGWHTWLSGTDWDSLDKHSMLKASSTGPHEVDSGGTASAFAWFRTGGAHAIRFQAKGSGGDATLAVRGRFSDE